MKNKKTTRLVIDVSDDEKDVTIAGSIKEAGMLLGEAAFLDGELSKVLSIASLSLLSEQGRISSGEYLDYIEEVLSGNIDLYEIMELGR